MSASPNEKLIMNGDVKKVKVTVIACFEEINPTVV
jgi:hypothetical protein